ncbi:tetratricopeptide repeat protein [Kushneria aurantia]|uniref:Tetratricopeptide repeat protein n=1 Tax=Kushneria aurantia TaxID=504092 RepID=A0ABV6G967_9GAMM|nr:tetratricopeptide repeat protein [Kushneria aurantia]
MNALFRPSIYRLVAGLLFLTALVGCAGPGGTTRDAADSPASAWSRLGLAYLQRDDIERAQQALERAIALSPADPDALQGLALIYQRQGEEQVADRYFRRALDQRPGFTRARNNYATFLFAEGHIAEACDQLERASNDLEYERRAQLFANLGQCRTQLDQTRAARDAWQRAVQIDPGQTRGWLGLAASEFQLQNPDASRIALRRYTQLGGDSEQSRQLARRLAMMETAP